MSAAYRCGSHGPFAEHSHHCPRCIEEAREILRQIHAALEPWFPAMDRAVHAYITRVAVSDDLPDNVHAAFREQLQECATPSAEVEAIPLRMVL